MQPEARYARLGRERIAYYVMGDRPLDLVVTSGSFGASDAEWEDPTVALVYRRLAAFARLIRFDRRGTGASDPLPLHALPPWESYVDELTAVLDEIGSERAALFAVWDAGPMAMLFAATRPERTRALILANTAARFLMADDYPFGIHPDVADQLIDQIVETWGTEAQAWVQVPSRAGDERFRSWFAKFLRSIATPTAVQAFFRALIAVDARHILPSIHVPTLVLHRSAYPLLPIEHGRYLAEHIPDARFEELPGSDGPLIWEHADLGLRLVEEFLTGVHGAAPVDRALATVLFTDIVGSTERAAEVGDARWRQLLDLHDETARALVARFHGRLVKTTGDGILATFDGPGRGIRCAEAFRHELHRLGLEIRCGFHTGEVELRGHDIGGLAVHIAARVMAAAQPGEVLVSSAVRDLVPGSDFRFEDRGRHALKGIEGEWELSSVVAG